MTQGFNFWKQKKRIHLDYASTTPVHPEVYTAMQPFFSKKWANASAIYAEGVMVRGVIDSARAKLAHILNVRPTDCIFTSGGTESNNLAIIGLIENLHGTGIAYEMMEIITTRIEHPSITETLRSLEKRGVVIRYIPLNSDGRIDVQALQTLLSSQTRLVTCAYVNSEIGVIQDVKKISRIVRAWNDAHDTTVRIHIDACQAPLWLPCALDMLGVDMLSLDAGKCYGPKGVGVLVKRHWVSLSPIMFGGGQEMGIRAGTENTALIVGCVEALVRAQKYWNVRSEKVKHLRDFFFEKITEMLPHVLVNGSLTHRVANNVNISIVGYDGEYAVITLDAQGICASTRSACGVGKGSGSAVVQEISGDTARALSTIRFTLGEESARADIIRSVDALKNYMTLMKSQIEN